MHIVLIEPHFVGHRPTYLYLYSKLLIELGYTVSILTEEVEKCKNYFDNEVKLPSVAVIPFIEINTNSTFLSKYSFYNKYVFWKRLKKSLKTTENIDFAIFMYFDYFLFNFNQIQNNNFFYRLKPAFFLNKYFLPYFIDKCLPVKWSGILFHSSHYQHSDYKYILKSKYNNSIAVLDETYNLNFEVKKKFALPDITDEQNPIILSELATTVQKEANGRKIISLLGSLEKRKGILPLLSVMQQMDPNKYFFLIAGKLDVTFSDDEKKIIAHVQQLENSHLITDGIPTEYDFNSLVKISDILYVVYIDFFHSSNLLTKAGLFEKPVLSLQGHCIGKRVIKYNMGITIATPDVLEIKNALENFDHLFDRSKNKFAEYFSAHSQTQLKQSLKSILGN